MARFVIFDRKTNCTMTKFILSVFIVLASFASKAQCTEEDTPQVLLLGDSWAFFMNLDETFTHVMEHWGHSNKNYYTNPDISVSGARTEDFLTTGRLTEIQAQLEAHPDINVVHISLSGNDFLGEWNVDFTPAETEALSDETYDEMLTLVDFIRGVRPSVHIVFSGYMYANFAEIIADAAPLETSHPFYGNWEDMGFPNFEQLNTLLNDFSDRLYDYASSDPGIDFVHVPALMQYVYGQEVPLGVDPGGTYPPLFQPLPYGDITYPSPKESMRNYGFARDCFHLSVDGFFAMIDYQFQKFYHKFLMDDAYFLADFSDENGNVSSDGSVSGVLNLGENGGVETKTILTFNTTGIADTVITNASIFLRRDSIFGGDPIGASVQLTMVNGNFGTGASLDAADFADEGDISGTACVFGLHAENTDWIRIDLPEAFLPLISNDGNVQFKIEVEGITGKKIFFTDGSDPEFAPVFNVKYKSDFVGLTENTLTTAQSDLILFPNPARENLNIYAPGAAFDRVEVTNLQGQVLLAFNQNITSLSVEGLSPGHYFLRLFEKDNLTVKAFVKN